MSATAIELIEGYSQALYSTWVWYHPFRILFDCGEGLASRLQNGVFAIENIFLSHGHLDHIGGLPSLFHIRGAGMGENRAPLRIYSPAGDPLVQLMRRFIERSVQRPEVMAEWLTLEPGQAVKIDSTRSVEAYLTDHKAGFPTLGYRVLEHRHRLKPELSGRAEEEIRSLARQGGREAVMVPYDHPLLVYGGDGLSPGQDVLQDADLACLEATFIAAEDRHRQVHSLLDEAVAAGAAAGVQALVLMHLSNRYRLKEIRAAAQAAVAHRAYPGRLVLLWKDRVVELEG